jgi:hypothetical protein
MRRSALVVTVGLAVAGLAACGSSSRSAASRPASTTTPQASLSADAKARAALVVLSDLPAGWTSTPHQSDPSSPSEDRQLKECAGVQLNSTSSQDINSPDFHSGDQFEVDSSASVATSAQAAAQELKAIKEPHFVSCLQTVLASVVRSQSGSSDGVTVGQVTVEPLSIGVHGDDTAGFHVLIPVTVQGRSMTFFMDLALVRIGRVELSDTFIGIGQPFDTALEQQLLTKADTRLTTV